MCIITNENDIVVSVSLIAGLGVLPNYFNVYNIYVGNIPSVGDYYKEGN